jgi:hypothetical protein
MIPISSHRVFQPSASIAAIATDPKTVDALRLDLRQSAAEDPSSELRFAARAPGVEQQTPGLA